MRKIMGVWGDDVKNRKRSRAGRKTKYFTHVEPRLIEVEGWARDGLIDEQIAKNLDVAVSTFNTYKKQYPELMESLKKGKEVVDREVENALLKRALGYQYEEVTHEPVYNKDTEKVELQPVKVVTKEVQPDTTAQIFWLKNRKPQQWRDRQDIQHMGEMNVNNPFADLSTEDLKKLIDK